MPVWSGSNEREFIPFELRQPQHTPGSVRALVEAPDGALWVGTGAGLARIPRASLDVFDQSMKSRVRSSMYTLKRKPIPPPFSLFRSRIASATRTVSRYSAASVRDQFSV